MNTIDRIIAAAQGCLESGDMSLRRVAQTAGLSLGTVTYYFRTKNELIAEVQRSFQAELGELLQQAAQLVMTEPDPRNRTEKGARLLVKWCQAHQSHLRLRALQVIGKGGYPDEMLSNMGKILDVCARSLAQVSARSEQEVRIALTQLTNGVVRCSSVDSPAQLAALYQVPEADVPALHEELYVQLITGYLFPGDAIETTRPSNAAVSAAN